MVIAKTLEIEQNFKQRPILKQTSLDIKDDNTKWQLVANTGDRAN